MSEHTTTTIGVEWEFLYAYVVGTARDPAGEGYGGGRRALLRVPPDDVEATNERDIWARAQDAVWERVEAAVGAATDMGVRTVPNSPRSWLTNWATYEVKYDHSVEAALPEDYHWKDVEVSSPVLDLLDPGLRAELEGVTRGLAAADRVQVNSTCALQVQVGIEGAVPLKKLATLLWLAEERLSMLYSELRRDGYWCRPLTEATRLALTANVPQRNGEGFTTWLAPVLARRPSPAEELRLCQLGCIWAAEDEQALGYLLSTDRADRPSYSFWNFERGRQKTVEFRSMQGTLDPRLVSAWALVCGSIVHAAKVAGVAAFHELLAKLLKPRQRYCVWDFLNDAWSISGLGARSSDGDWPIRYLKHFVYTYRYEPPADKLGPGGFIEPETLEGVADM